MKRLDKKMAIVTGGARGIGREICKRFIDEGAIVYAADLNQGEEIKNATFLQLNVCDEASVQAAVNLVLEKEKRIDILVNNAG